MEVTVLTHSVPGQTAPALRCLIEEAGRAHATLRFDPEETAKHGLVAREGVLLDAPVSPKVALCVVLGGDGTILRALRLYARTKVPVFAVNYGEVGFLASVSQDELQAGMRRALAGDFELLHLPAIVVDGADGEKRAFNDVAVHRKAGDRVARLAYALDGDELGSVRCDGLVVATPAGSTGYNLANGGPVMAWGVEWLAVSFIAPHSLTARALIVAPQDALRVRNRSREEPVDVSVDGRPVCELDPDGAVTARFKDGVGALAQTHDASFYHRLREKFGRLASGV